MSDRPVTSGTRSAPLHAVLAALPLSPHPDGELLARFVADGDQEAFAELVRRLGPSVYGVCRRFLGHTPDAEDAFQATFLVLARKAASVRPPGKVAAWVHGVATLAARKARAARTRRARREVTAAVLPDRPAPEVVVDPGLTPAVDEELNRLPDRLRLPILLCELHERTVVEAAAELGWPVGTVASRLSRGRVLLASRLSRRGLGAVGAVLLSGRLSRAATAAVPGRLVAEAVRVAGGAGSAPGVVTSLASEVRRAMKHSNAQLLAAGLVAAAAIAVVAGLGLVPNSTAAPVRTPAAAPVPDQPHAAAAIDRVRLSDLSGMLRQAPIRKDLNITEDQARAVEEARREANAELKGKVEEVMRNMVLGQLQRAGGPVRMRLDPELMTGVLNDHHARLERQILDHLRPEQVRRLRQINLQVGGVASLLDRRVIRELGLSADQEDRIDPLVRKRISGIIPADDTARAAEQADALLAEALQILTPVQRQKWEVLIGKPVPTADLIKAGPYSEETQAENSSSNVLRGRTPPKAAPPPAVPNRPK